MRILFIGDIFGRPGRKAVNDNLKDICSEYGIDFVIANGENASGGSGLTKENAKELFNYGIDALTMGNHVWDKKEILQFIKGENRIIRPANYPEGTPGQGWQIFDLRGIRIAVINLLGRVFMSGVDCPFRTADIVLEKTDDCVIKIVDFHAEATSEKEALGWYLDGRVSAVLGTHTHVQTADERILPGGTAYISDVGMTGPRDSILGVDKDIILEKFITCMPHRHEVAHTYYQLNAVWLDIDTESGTVRQIERIQTFEY